MQAQVKWFNDSKGYGFLKGETKDIFVHYSQIMTEGFKTLSEGQDVEFELVEGKNGPMAVKVFKKD